MSNISGLDNDPVTNYTFAYPDLESVIGTGSLMLIVFLPWYLLFIISTICLYFIDKQFDNKQVLKQLYLMTRMLLFSFVVCLLIIDLIKLFVGSPRPYFLDTYQKYKNNEIERKIG